MSQTDTIALNKVGKVEEQLRQHQQSGKYLEMIVLGEWALSNAQNFSIEILLLVLEACSKLEYWARLIALAEAHEAAVTNSSYEDRQRLAFSVADALSQLGKFVEAAEKLENLKKLAQKNTLSDQIIEDLNNKIAETKKKASTKSLDERREEAKDVYNLFQKTDDEEYFKKEGCPVFVIPMAWFEQWKLHTNFNELVHEDDDLMEDEKDDSDHYPGMIEPSALLSLSLHHLKDPDPVKEYTNHVIKPELQRDKDFLLVSKSVQKYLFEKYHGRELKRLIVSISDDNDSTHVELHLKRIDFFVFHPGGDSSFARQLTVQRVYICKKETETELKDKILRCLAHIHGADVKKQKIRALKLTHSDTVKTLWNEYTTSLKSKKSQRVPVKAKCLEEGKSLEEYEISEEDIIVIEFYNDQTKSWILQHPGERQVNEACANCQSTKDLKSCQCLTIKYCSQECLKEHRPYHKNDCLEKLRQLEGQRDLLRKLQISEACEIGSYSKRGLTGLQNLGNTCFMNSSLQCLSNILDLTQYMISNQFVKDINADNPLGCQGKLASAYAELMKEIWCGSHSYVSAWQLKKIVAKFAPQFNGYQQQDSQELLNYILDGIHEDLNRVKKKPFVEALDFNDENNERDAKLAWENYLKRNQSFVQEKLVGQFKSTIQCPDCKRISITFDPFISVSLPILQEQATTPLQPYFIFRDSRRVPLKLNLTPRSNQTVPEVIQLIVKEIGEQYNPKNLELALIRDHRIEDSPKDRTTVKQLGNHKGIIFVYELSDPKIGDIPIESPKYLHIKWQPYVRENTQRNTGNTICSYPRYLLLPHQSNFKDVHLAIYAGVRPFLRNFYERIDESLRTNDNYYNFDESLIRAEQVAGEYEELLARKFPLYTLYFTDDQSMQELKYTAEEAFCTRYKILDKQEVPVDLVLNSIYREFKQMKFNRCQEHASEAPVERPRRKLETTIYDCLDLFTTTEVLDRGNEWYCSKCKKQQQATKKMEIYRAPQYLILHLKRFKSGRLYTVGSHYFEGGSSKINSFVSFPTENLDLTNYIVSNKVIKNDIKYDLFAVSNHYGGMGGGHYTAYAKNPIFKKWYEFNDSHASAAREQDVVSEAAYVLFYKLREIAQ